MNFVFNVLILIFLIFMIALKIINPCIYNDPALSVFLPRGRHIGTMTRLRAPPLLQWVVAVFTYGAMTSPVTSQSPGPAAAAVGVVSPDLDLTLTFTSPRYNGSIYENTVGVSYIRTPQRMGVSLERLPASLEVEFSIVGGDGNHVFKAEAVPVKDFCFLRIRTRTVNYYMLNREWNSLYHLRVKARGSYPGDVVLEAFTDVVVTVLDQNEFSPMFSNRPYEVTIPEDTPLYQSIGSVKASDADVGVNGEIYYR